MTAVFHVKRIEKGELVPINNKVYKVVTRRKKGSQWEVTLEMKRGRK